MNYKRYIITLFFTPLIITCGLSQDKDYKIIIPPKVEVKLNTIYPLASDIYWIPRYPSDKIQVVTFNCNCPEGTGHLIVTFDTNGTILGKSISITKQGLPGNISNYITNNYPNDFNYVSITKISNNEGVAGYTIELQQFSPDGSTPVTGAWIYVLKFKGSGEFISSEKKQ